MALIDLGESITSGPRTGVGGSSRFFFKIVSVPHALPLSQILIILDEGSGMGGGRGRGTWAGCLPPFLRVAIGLDMVPEDFCFGFEELVILKK